MRVGILTFHRAHNYGAVLQCYALQEVIESMGHDVCVIDYRQPAIENTAVNWWHIRRLLWQPRLLLRYLRCMPKRIRKERLFSGFREKFLKTSRPCYRSLPQDIDCYVIGSDQLWSLHCLLGEPDRFYLGDFKRPADSAVIGYAISSNAESLNTLIACGLKTSVGNFTSLSVREPYTASFLSKNIGKEVDVCVDPTLLTDADLWKPVLNDKWKDRDYVLMYHVRAVNDSDKVLKRKSAEMAHRMGWEVIDLSEVTYTVEDFVSLFKYARYVVTTSFHAAVFSIIFGTPFYVACLNDGHDGRYVNLLKEMGLEDCLIDVDTEIIPRSCDFSGVQERMRTYAGKSMGFLIDSLK